MANTAVFGIYNSREETANAVEALQRAGYRATDISALLPENQGTKDLAPTKYTKAPEGMAFGTALGVIAGGVFGFLVEIGAWSIPELAPFTGTGAVMSTMAGAGAGAVIGGLTGALTGLGFPEYVTKRYTGRVKRGGILLSVHCDNSEWVSRARGILEATGARGIASAAEAPADFAKSDKPMPRRGVCDTAIQLRLTRQG